MRYNKQNIIIYIVFILIAFIGINFGNAIYEKYNNLRIWQFENILMLAIGIPFLFLQTKAGIPNFIDEQVQNKKRFLQPFLIGAIFGLLDIIVIKIIQHPEAFKELPPFLQPFPYSIFLYFSGAFEIEVFYRLIPMTTILLIGQWISKGKFFNYFLWTAILLTSIREPLEQMPSGSNWFICYSLLTGFLMNYLQAIYYKNAGFLATLSIRLGHYLFWHILLGVYVQFIELNSF
jgi:hypothetical protein